MGTAFEPSDLVEGLLSPAAYPHAADRIELVETHISWVFLTGEVAYKIKKPVDLGYLDFTTLEKRRRCCEDEVRLNHRWAPRIYRDVVPIVMTAGRPRVARPGTPIEYAVRMWQFDPAMRLDRQLAAGQVDASDMLEMAAEIARRHLDARRVAANKRCVDVTRQLIHDNYPSLARRVPAAFLSTQRRWMDDRLEQHDALLGKRCESGFFRECHGDLHLGNLVRLPEGIRAFDCIEFNRDLREIDVVCDYAFLVMDLMARGATDLASVFLNRYLEITGDYEGACLLPMYTVYRSLVRAKILTLGRISQEAPRRQPWHRYLALARTLARHRQPTLVAMTGLSGSGKSWLSSQLLRELPAVRLRSDLERKRLAGLAPSASSDSGIEEGLYDPTVTEDVYAALLENAGKLLRAGIDVILDAAFLKAPLRRRARRLATETESRFVLVETTASQAALRQRILRRRETDEPSEAGLEVLDHQLAAADPYDADDRGSLLSVDTETDIDIARMIKAIRGSDP